MKISPQENFGPSLQNSHFQDYISTSTIFQPQFDLKIGQPLQETTCGE